LVASRTLDWSTALPDAPGLWWLRIPDTGEELPVEYVPTDRDPLILYHTDRRFRWLSDEWFEGKEWRGPVARRTANGLWYFTG
jgi:hypothetical protein